MESERLAVAFGRVVRELRKEAGFSQEAFAYHCGIHRTFMGRIERGQPDLSFSSALKIAGGLNVALSQLMEQAEARAAAG